MVYRGGQGQDLVDEEEGQDEDDRMRDLASEARGRKAQQQLAGPGPHLGQHIILDEDDVLDLAPKPVEELELGLGAPVRLTLVEDLLGHLVLQDLGRLGALQHAELAQAEETLEEVLGDREPDDQLLPGEERAVEEARKSLCGTRTRLLASRLDSEDRHWEPTRIVNYLENIHLSGVDMQDFL